MNQEKSYKINNNPQSIIFSDDKSEEVQAIVDRMPTRGATYVAYIVILLIIITIALGYSISYPDTVNGRISITSSTAPVRLVSQNNGRICLLYENGKHVDAGNILAYIDNAAKIDKILWVEENIFQPFDTSEYKKFNSSRESMGELSGVFNQYCITLGQYLRQLNSNLYPNQIKNINEQISTDIELLSFVDESEVIRSEASNMAFDRLNLDSVLYNLNAVTQQEINRQKGEYLNLRESYLNAKSNRTSIKARINKNKIEIQKLEIERSELLEKYFSDVIARRSELQNQIAIWKERYLIISPISGNIQYLGFWKDHGYIKNGEEIISIIPQRQSLMGEVRVPAIGIGKIKIGQTTNVKIDNYPYDEFGLIKGVVRQISNLSSLINTKDGEAETYLVIIEFPEGMSTNFGKTLDVDFETKGTAEIITKKKKLIERLFDNLKSIGTK